MALRASRNFTTRLANLRREYPLPPRVAALKHSFWRGGNFTPAYARWSANDSQPCSSSVRRERSRRTKSAGAAKRYSALRSRSYFTTLYSGSCASTSSPTTLFTKLPSSSITESPLLPLPLYFSAHFDYTSSRSVRSCLKVRYSTFLYMSSCAWNHR